MYIARISGTSRQAARRRIASVSLLYAICPHRLPSVRQAVPITSCRYAANFRDLGHREKTDPRHRLAVRRRVADAAPHHRHKVCTAGTHHRVCYWRYCAFPTRP